MRDVPNPPAPGPIATADQLSGRRLALSRLAAFFGWTSARGDAAGLLRTWTVFWRSRLLIWVAGCTAFVLLGTESGAVQAFDPAGVSVSFGRIGNVLAAPAVRWDSIWYLQIAHDGYRSATETRFFPLYPLLIRAGSWISGSMVFAGIVISLAALLAGLEIVRRLTALELGARASDATVQLIAFGPMALFLSAVYTESLFIALTAATFYAARRGRWAIAGSLGGLAGMTRIGGILILAPVLLLFFYGPRTDSPPMRVTSRWRPRYGFTPEVLWSALIPAGAALVPLFMLLRGFGPAATLHAQEQFSSHEIALPIVSVWDGAQLAWHQLRLDLAGVATPTYQSQAMLQLGVLLLASVALVGVFRRLPFAYGAYVTLGLLQHLASPTIGDPLRGFDRYASMRFPLFMWLGAWAVERRAMRPILAVSILMLVFFTCQFATWRWVGTPQL